MKLPIIVAAVAAMTMAIPGAVAAEPVNLKISHFLPPMHQIHGELTSWADQLRDKSNGELNIEVFAAGQMGPPPRQLDLARTGVADMAFIFTAFSPGRFPRTDILSLPFLLANENGGGISTADASWLATNMRDEFSADNVGVNVLYYVTLSSLGFFMRDEEVANPGNLEGLRMRPTSSSVAGMLEAMGASPASLPPTEVADAIGKGVVDGAIFNFEGGKAFGLAQSVKDVSTLGFTAATFALVINSDVYDKLSDEMKTLIDESTGPEAARRVGGLYDASEIAGREFMEGKGVKVYDIRGGEAQPFRDVLSGIGAAQIEALKSKGIDGEALVSKVEDLKSKL